MKSPLAILALLAAFVLSASLAAAMPQSADRPARVRVGAVIQEGKLIHQVTPEYPPAAREARIEGTVRLQVLIAEDGTVKEIRVLDGHPLLATPAVRAVRQWRYRETLLNNRPVEVVTIVELVFSLGTRPQSPTVEIASASASREGASGGALGSRIEELQQQARLSPDDAEAHFKLAVALRSRNSWDAAIASAREAVRLDPFHLQARLLLGNILLNGKRDFDEAILVFREAARYHPESAEAFRAQAEAHQRRGDLLRAIEQYREAARAKPESRQDYFELGRLLYHKWNPELAASEFRSAAERAPDAAELHLALAGHIKDSVPLAAAIAQFREALAHNPEDPGARETLALLLGKKSQNERQMEQFRARIKENPDDFDARRQLALQLIQTNADIEGALAEFREMIRIRPSASEVYRTLAVYLARRDGPESAIVELRERTRRNPDAAGWRVALAALLEQWGDLDAALIEARQAVQLQPDDPGAHQQLALVLGAMGDAEGARAARERAAELRGAPRQQASPDPGPQANQGSAADMTWLRSIFALRFSC